MKPIPSPKPAAKTVAKPATKTAATKEETPKTAVEPLKETAPVDPPTQEADMVKAPEAVRAAVEPPAVETVHVSEPQGQQVTVRVDGNLFVVNGRQRLLTVDALVRSLPSGSTLTVL